jgi:ribosome-binding factor A
MPGARMRRVNEAVREVISAHIAGDLKDPRIGFVTVTSVDTSPDLRHARVYVSVLGDESERERALAGLSSSRGFLQAKLNEDLRLKHTPTLAFEYDPSVEHGVRMTRLIEEAVRSEGADATGSDATGSDATDADEPGDEERRW